MIVIVVLTNGERLRVLLEKETVDSLKAWITDTDGVRDGGARPGGALTARSASGKQWHIIPSRRIVRLECVPPRG